MADADALTVPADVYVASADPCVARERHVRAAVAALLRDVEAAGGAGRAATYLRHVEQWERDLDPQAERLAAFPTLLKNAGQRLPASPPGIRAARDAFVRAIGLVRQHFRVVRAKAPRSTRRVSQVATLSEEVSGDFVSRASSTIWKKP